MGVIGLLVAMVLNLFLAEHRLITWLISIVGVVLFTALTAYDVQRIRSGDLAATTGSMEKAAVVGALRLYLDFINLFLFMLRLLRRPQLTRVSSRGVPVAAPGPRPDRLGRRLTRG